MEKYCNYAILMVDFILRKNTISKLSILLIFILIILSLALIHILGVTKKNFKKNIESKERFESLFDNMNEGFSLHEVVLNEDGKVIDYIFLEVNKAFENITDLKENEIKNKRVKEVLPDIEESWIELFGQVATSGKSTNFQNYSANIGKYFNVNVYSPRKNQFASIFTDITYQIEANLRLDKEKTLFKTTIDSLGDGVISTDKFGKIEIMNPIAEEISGWKLDEVKGLEFEKVFNIIDENTRKSKVDELLKVFENGQTLIINQNTLLIRKDNSCISIEDSVAPIKDDNDTIIGIVIVFRDFTDKKEKLERISYLSYHDQLTGLYNRHFFEEELKRLDSLRNLPLSLALLDVNGLKLTNDAFGHKVGDELLVKVADILKAICRTDDIISRVGGDEFVIMLPKTTDIEAENLVKRLYEEIEKSTMNNIIVSVSIGHKTKKLAQQNISEIFAEAEENMYRKKLTESPVMRRKTIELIFRNLNETNPLEKSHSQYVSDLCIRIGESLGLSPQTLEELKLAGMMHDIGKIAINSKVLNKSGVLNPTELIEMRRHPEIGYHILKSVDDYSNISEYVLSHHEKWDGTGYPRELSGDNIPLISRIINIADAFEAMTSDRSYRDTKTAQQAIKEIENLSGKDFDPNIIRTLLEDSSFIW